jgi:hypothetical protein
VSVLFGGWKFPMHSTPEELLDDIEKIAALFRRDVIVALELLNMAMDIFAFTDCVPELVPRIWDVIPEAVRDDFGEAVRCWANPDFRYIARHYHGGSDEEHKRASEIPSQRLREWAREFLSYWSCNYAKRQ